MPADNRLPTNQSQLDIVEKLDEIKDAIAQGGGGGGTGGHTIIDENGNSMTARAGLQFVGGANVSDDSTNNKTIVDIASAGGIDGVFIDTDNVIVPKTSYNPSSFSYTATEDCVLYIEIPAKGGYSTFLEIDGKEIQGVNLSGSGTTNYLITTVFLKKGQIVTLSSSSFPSVTPDYAVYGIQTGTTHSKFQPIIYSTEEREIGVWTDGKPLYEKTIDFGAIPNNTSKSVAHGISDLDKVVSFDGVMMSSDSFETLPSGENSNFRLTANDTNISIRTNASWTDWSNSYITIRYTKSSDTAGSGSWTPQGVPTHHYSTDEQVIGTWIDGKTLYEKTIIITSLPSDTEAVEYTISNETINLLSYEGTVIFSSGNKGSLPYTNISPTYLTIDEIKRSMINTQINANGKFWVRCGQDRSNCSAFVTVRYTKSS